MKKYLIFFLCLALLASLSVPVIASDEPDPDAAEVSVSDTEPAQPEPEEAPTEPAEEIPAEAEPVTDAAPADEIITVGDSAVAYLPDDSDALLTGYLEQLSGVSIGGGENVPVTDTAEARDNLNKRAAYIYDELRTVGQNTACGENDGTIITISGLTYDDSLLNDAKNAVNALLMSCPYELYWIASGCPVAYNASYNSLACDLTISIPVNPYYASGDPDAASGLYYATDSEKIASAYDTARNALTVVEEAANLSDYEKVLYYKNWICDAVSYNDYAAEHGATKDANPWQLIYVFDNDPDTNVVCEGYSKAFKFLCDLTDFNSSEIYCLYVTGGMGVGSWGGHAWNILHMDDGKNYLVDVTNCDGEEGEETTTLGYPDLLFLKAPQSGTADNIYYFYTLDNTSLLAYYYDNDTLNNFLIDWLTLSNTDYDPSAVPTPTPTATSTPAATPTPTPTATPVPTATPTTTPTATPAPTAVPTATPAATAASTAEPTATPTATPAATAASTAEPTATPTTTPAPTAEPTGSPEPTEVPAAAAGDLDGNGLVNISDALRLFRSVNGQIAVLSADAADLNGDGRVNISDALRLFRYVNGQIDTL